MHRLISAPLFALLFLLAGTSTIFADPPGRVARLNYLSGEVSLKRSGDQDWTRAFVNDPLTTSDDLWTDTNSRAEVHIGSKIVRLGPQTHVAFAQIDDRTIRLAVLQGEIEVHLRELDLDDTLEVDSPVAATTVLRTGDYRFEVPTDDQTVVTTRHGQADVLFKGPVPSLPAASNARFRAVPYKLSARPGSMTSKPGPPTGPPARSGLSAPLTFHRKSSATKTFTPTAHG
jgi:hypothetical protein